MHSGRYVRIRVIESIIDIQQKIPYSRGANVTVLIGHTIEANVFTLFPHSFTGLLR